MTTSDHILLQEAARRLDIPDTFTAIGHGPDLSMRIGDEYFRLPRSLRFDIISENRGDRPVMLLSCRTGSMETPDGRLWAQKLSDDLGGVAVMAATSQVWWSRDGDTVIARAYWSTNGVGRNSSGGTLDQNAPGEFRIFGGDVTDFGFRALPRGSQIREIRVNYVANIATIVAYDPRGNRVTRTRSW